MWGALPVWAGAPLRPLEIRAESLLSLIATKPAPVSIYSLWWDLGTFGQGGFGFHRENRARKVRRALPPSQS
jgi:hypothetical protein